MVTESRAATPTGLSPTALSGATAKRFALFSLHRKRSASEALRLFITPLTGRFRPALISIAKASASERLTIMVRRADACRRLINRRRPG
jgi:hypothetical protein